MKRSLKTVLIAWMSLTAMHAEAQEARFEKFGLYVVAKDLDASRRFYERLFEKPPYVSNAGLVGFDIAGGLYAVFAAKAADRKWVQGNSAVPYIRVKNAQREFQRMKSLAVTMLDARVVKEGPLELFRIADPDGNVVEFFSLAN